MAQYPLWVQERIVAWQDALIVDESKRQTKESDAKIAMGTRGQWMAFAGLAGFGAGAYALAIHGCPWQVVGLFLSIPVMGVLVALLPSRKSQSDSQDQA